MKTSNLLFKRTLYLIICLCIFTFITSLIFRNYDYNLFFCNRDVIWSILASVLWVAVISAFTGIIMSLLSIVKKDFYTKTKYIIGGLIPFMFDMIWLFFGLERLYGQNGGGILYNILIPEWILLLNIVGAIVGIILSIMIMKKQTSIYKGIIINLILFIVLFAIEQLYFFL